MKKRLFQIYKNIDEKCYNYYFLYEKINNIVQIYRMVYYKFHIHIEDIMKEDRYYYLKNYLKRELKNFIGFIEPEEFINFYSDREDADISMEFIELKINEISLRNLKRKFIDSVNRFYIDLFNLIKSILRGPNESQIISEKENIKDFHLKHVPVIFKDKTIQVYALFTPLIKMLINYLYFHDFHYFEMPRFEFRGSNYDPEDYESAQMKRKLYISVMDDIEKIMHYVMY